MIDHLILYSTSVWKTFHSQSIKEESKLKFMQGLITLLNISENKVVIASKASHLSISTKYYISSILAYEKTSQTSNLHMLYFASILSLRPSKFVPLALHIFL